MPIDSVSSSFRLRKWYMDCTTEDGSVVIGYWARVRWGRLRVGYAAVTRSSSGVDHPRTLSTLRAGAEPEHHGNELIWGCATLGLQGRWEQRCPAAKRTLFKAKDGAVHWSCAMPRASCRVRLRDEVFDGMGYAELLDMSIAPWRLPIRELRWGRWLSEDTSVTWINWRGPFPLTLVLNDGTSVDGVVGDDCVHLGGDRRLSLTTDRTIRSGTLGATVFGSLGGLSKSLPPALARTHEVKWLSRGTLSPESRQGWSIHERIVFGE